MILNKLKLNPKNPRTISKVQFEKLKKSIKSFPRMLELRPIVYDDDMIVLGGNMRLRAIKELQLGSWDENLLANDWGDLPLDDWGIDTKGWDKEVEEDEVPEVDEELEPVSKLGEVYKLGRHRLMCGDSTKIEDVEKLMNGQKADMVFTSPPYNMGADMYENYEDNLKSQEYIDFNLEVIHTWLPFLKGYLFWNISYNKNSRWEFLEIMYRIIKETGLRFLEMIVWDKGHGIPITSADMLTRQYEDILFVGDEESVSRDMELFYMGTKYKRAYMNKKTNRGITNYWKVDTNKTQIENHSACFPVKLPAKAINLVTQPNEIVVDMFGGSGSTLIACEQLNRTCYMMELGEKYCDVIRRRYWKYVNGSEDGWEVNTPEYNYGRSNYKPSCKECA